MLRIFLFIPGCMLAAPVYHYQFDTGQVHIAAGSNGCPSCPDPLTFSAWSFSFDLDGELPDALPPWNQSRSAFDFQLLPSFVISGLPLPDARLVHGRMYNTEDLGEFSLWVYFDSPSLGSFSYVPLTPGAPPITHPGTFHFGGWFIEAPRIDAATPGFVVTISAIPEPAGLALTGTGLVALVWLWRFLSARSGPRRSPENRPYAAPRLSRQIDACARWAAS